jgi:hypothetical protein
MSALVAHIWLFAVRRQAMAGGFRGENNDYDVTQLAVVVGVLAAVVGVLFLLDRWIRRRSRLRMYESPTELFRQLCKAHQLDRAACHQLKQLAAHWQLAHPALLFVEPDYFRPERLPSDWFERVPQIEQIHRKLFEAL